MSGLSVEESQSNHPSGGENDRLLDQRADAGVECPGSFTTETKEELIKSVVSRSVWSISVIVAVRSRVGCTKRLSRKGRWLDASRDRSPVGSRLHLAHDALPAPRRLTVTDAPVRGDQA